MTSSTDLAPKYAGVKFHKRDADKKIRELVLSACKMRRVKVTNILKMVGTRRSFEDMISCSTSVFMLSKIATILEVPACALLYGTNTQLKPEYRCANFVGKRAFVYSVDRLRLYYDALIAGIPCSTIGDFLPISNKVNVGSAILFAQSGCSQVKDSGILLNIDDIIGLVVQQVEIGKVIP